MKPKYRRAIGIEYDEVGEGAPTLGVKGFDLEADEIVKIARQYGIPVVERAEMAALLGEVELDEEIPPTLYEAVAALFHEIEEKVR